MFPTEMMALPHWVCWKAVPDEARPGKIKKLPINAKTGNSAASNDPSTWCDYETALSASVQYNGLGFMFSGSGLFGVDIDGISDDITEYVNGEDNIVTEFIETLQSYAEVSQSGNGIHIICRGSLPDGGRRKNNVEMYDAGRFFIMTGKEIGGYSLNDGTESIKPLHAKYIGAQKPTEVYKHDIQPLDLTEQEIISAIQASKQGNAFDLLYRGDWQGLYSSQSDADIAFCNILAFWTAKDVQKMDAIFRSSGLFRKKWDERRGNKGTYGQITLQKAIEGCMEVWQPQPLDDYSITVLDMETKRVTEEQPKRLYSFDDTGNGQLFYDTFYGVVLYSYVDKRWYWYSGKKWEYSQKGEIDHLIDMLIEKWGKYRKYYVEEDNEDQAKAFDKWYKQMRSRRSKEAWIKEAMHLVPADMNQFDRDIFVLNVQNGVVDLKTSNLTERKADMYFSKITNAEYSEKLDCPQWKEFLNTIFDGDQELIRYVQKAIGYTLTGSTAEQCIFICVGEGRNGKTTFIDIMSEIMGDYAVNIQPETIMVKRSSGGANSDIARLRGARMVTSSEPNEGSRLDEGLIKQLSGGDKVTARHQYGSEFEFEPIFKLWMGTNHKPIIRGRDEGIWRRIRIIPFNVRIPDEKVNKNLKYELRKEYAGILNWMIEGCLLWQIEGLKMPKVMEDSLKEYRNEMDVIEMFLDECCETVAGAETKASELYSAYSDWAKANNEYLMTSSKFGIEITKRYEKVKKKTGIYYKGIKRILSVSY